jgi:hypothetical protein
MENTKIKSSTLISIFKRKGGEGLLTKIVTHKNRINYLNQLELLEENENLLLSFKEDELSYLLLTDKRVLIERVGVKLSIYFPELMDVNIAIQEEFKDNILNKEDFTRLILKDNKGNSYLVKIEKGQSFQGLYQILHHISSNNKNSLSSNPALSDL